MDDARTGPLAGLKIVEFAGLGPGPLAAMLLADLGADVVRVERAGTERMDPRDVVARGRRFVALDLKDPGSSAAARRLCEAADVLIEGFRPGVMERLGLGPDDLLATNPRLVYARMTGWGQTGPLANAVGHDINYIAITGALAAIGPKERPVAPLNLLGDYGGGSLYLVMGILAAVVERGRSGRGQVIDCAICDNVGTMMSIFQTFARRGLLKEEREANMLDGGAHYYGVYACADGRHVALGAIEPQFYAALRRLAGLDDDAYDAQNDRAGWPELRRRMEALFATRTQREWCDLLEGTDACVAPVLALSEAPSHPHLAARGSFATREDGAVEPAPTPRFSRTQGPLPPRAPTAPTPLDEILDGWQADAKQEA
ncbi:CaiB/BaiF CoA transferase family protein [Acuticoccus sp.]|uniref:CaiB/BaiF CoA transferase family protein n=1 Tax=Acuticoccus sp. TaxID=1904378 RepID=UPI003B52C0BB